MRLPLTIFVDDDVDTKLPPPPTGNPKVDIEVRLQPQELELNTDNFWHNCCFNYYVRPEQKDEHEKQLNHS